MHHCSLHGTLPTSQKQVLDTAWLKKSSLKFNPTDLNSFRPISNLSFLSKLIERAVATQLTTHIDTNHLLPDRQSAYRRLHSIESIVYNDIIRVVDDGNVVAMALLDLSSAFGTVDHASLLSMRRSRFSVSSQALARFQSYLTDRTQIFTTVSSQSLPLPLFAGSPQGSGLGPVQFISYTENTTTICFTSWHPISLVRRRYPVIQGGPIKTVPFVFRCSIRTG